MKGLFNLWKRIVLEVLLAGALVAICFQFVLLTRPEVPFAADLSLRNADYPSTYIAKIYVDLTSPNHWVRLNWSGSQAEGQETGPFHGSPGRGLGKNNCNDVAESNRTGSFCRADQCFNPRDM
jgi:hypothetical protein